MHKSITDLQRLPLRRHFKDLIYSLQFLPPKGKHKISSHEEGKDCWRLRKHLGHFYQPRRRWRRSRWGRTPAPHWAHSERHRMPAAGGTAARRGRTQTAASKKTQGDPKGLHYHSTVTVLAGGEQQGNQRQGPCEPLSMASELFWLKRN